MHSYHNFLFPFRFDKKVKEKDGFETRVNIDKNFLNILEKYQWDYQKFRVKNHLDYNELVYFYDFVKDALFNTKDFELNATSYYFEKQDCKEEYTIKVKAKEEAYKLKLTGISLRVFDTGVGILSFEVENHNYHELEDILKINEFGRRIYPQFLGKDFSLDDTRGAFLPEYMYVNGITEDFIQSDFSEIKLASFILETLGGNFTKTYSIKPLLDDRMFTLCWYGNDEFSKKILNNIEDDDWYRYVFVDNGKMVQDGDMQKELIKNATYTRWKNYQTFYGITRYSFMCATSSIDTLKKNKADFIINHIKTIYFQMSILLLAQRTSILRFSDEITAISNIDKMDKELTDKISNLYKHYLRFKNKLYFKEVTPQEQGIELYDKARNIMRIDSDIDDLSREIQSLNSYAYILEEKDEKKQMHKVTKLGTYLLPPTFIAGVFGMNVFGTNTFPIDSNWYGMVAFVSLSIITIIGMKFLIKENHE